MFFALSCIGEGARRWWPGVADAERAAAEAAVAALLAPEAGKVSPPLRVTGKASSVLVEGALWSWPERNPRLVAGHIEAAEAAVAAPRAGTDPILNMRRAVVSVSVAAGVLSEAAAASSSVGTAERTAARHRPGFADASRTSALRRARPRRPPWSVWPPRRGRRRGSPSARGRSRLSPASSAAVSWTSAPT